MSNTEAVLGSGLKIVVLTRGARAEARRRRPRCVDAHCRPDPRRHPACVQSAGRSSSRRPTWSSRSARRSTPRSTATEQWSCRGGCSSTCRDCFPTARSSSSIREEESILQVRCGPAEYRLNTYSAEDFPRLPDVDAAPTHTVETRMRCSRRSASVGRAVSRDEARPVLTGILVALRRREARHGGDRLVPALVQGDADRGQGARARGDRAGACARGGPPARDRRRHARARRPGEPGAVRDRRHVADDAPHRGPVPEVRRAAAEGVHARGRRSRARSCSRSSAARR